MADSPQKVLTISELNRMARLALEKTLPSSWVCGELSNFTRAASGHWYFTIKDDSASARCVMFRPRNQFVEWAVREGDHIEIRAQASLYEARGDFQLVVEAMRKAGQGSLFEAFMRLKEKLQHEGLFNQENKRPIPAFPSCVGVITSPQAAALRDVLTTLSRQWPPAQIIIYPCLVQGEPAPDQIQTAINLANQRGEADVLLLVRGGGSLEDLWAFNQESVARAIAASSIPIITGIGHESDFCIADFASDLRAPTPTGAAQMAVPDCMEWARRLMIMNRRMVSSIRSRINTAWQRNDHLTRRLRHPHERHQLQKKQLAHLTQRLAHNHKRSLTSAFADLGRLHKRLAQAFPTLTVHYNRLDSAIHRLHTSQVHLATQRQVQLHHLRSKLGLLCPELVLKRGYSIVRNDRGELVTGPGEISVGQDLDIEFATGHVGATVNRK